MRRVLILIIVLSAGCTEPSEIGANFFQPSNVDVLSTDTLSLNLYTIKLDSVATGNPTRLLAGTAQDSELGTVSASAFFEVLPEDFSGEYYLESETTRFSRVSLVAVYDGYSYYDTLSQVELQVLPLIEDLEANDDGYFYNTTDFGVGNSIGSLSFNPAPGQKDTLEIPLNQNYGQRIYDGLVSNTEQYANASEILEVLPGFALVPLSGNSVLGFSSTVELRIYYWDSFSVPVEEKYVSFSSASGDKFNQIQSDRLITDLTSLTNSKGMLPSTGTGGRSFIQSGDALCLRLEIPNLNSILLENKDIVITSATLYFAPQRGSNTGNKSFANSLVMYEVNEINEIIAQYSSSSATLASDISLDRDTHYRVDVTEYVIARLNAGLTSPESALLFTQSDSDLGISVNRLYVDDQKNNSLTKLRVNFLNINKK